MKHDIGFKEFRDETVIYAETPKGASWIAKHITTNIADLHYSDKQQANAVLEDMAKDGLKVVRLDCN